MSFELRLQILHIYAKFYAVVCGAYSFFSMRLCVFICAYSDFWPAYFSKNSNIEVDWLNIYQYNMLIFNNKIFTSYKMNKNRTYFLKGLSSSYKWVLKFARTVVMKFKQYIHWLFDNNFRKISNSPYQQ